MAFSLQQITTVTLYGVEWKTLPRVGQADLYSLKSVKEVLGLQGTARDLLNSVKLTDEETHFWKDQLLFGKSSSGPKRKDYWITWLGVVRMVVMKKSSSRLASELLWQSHEGVCPALMNVSEGF